MSANASQKQISDVNYDSAPTQKTTTLNNTNYLITNNNNNNDDAISSSEIASPADCATGSSVNTDNNSSILLLNWLIGVLVCFMLVSLFALYLLKFLRSQKRARKRRSAPADSGCGCALCTGAWLSANDLPAFGRNWPITASSSFAQIENLNQTIGPQIVWSVEQMGQIIRDPPPPYSPF